MTTATGALCAPLASGALLMTVTVTSWLGAAFVSTAALLPLREFSSAFFAVEAPTLTKIVTCALTVSVDTGASAAFVEVVSTTATVPAPLRFLTLTSFMAYHSIRLDRVPRRPSPGVRRQARADAKLPPATSAGSKRVYSSRGRQPLQTNPALMQLVSILELQPAATCARCEAFRVDAKVSGNSRSTGC